MLGASARECVGELLVPGRSQKGERRDQGAGADAGHDVELRSLAALGKTDERARPERASCSAARQCEEVQRSIQRCRAPAMKNLREAGPDRTWVLVRIAIGVADNRFEAHGRRCVEHHLGRPLAMNRGATHHRHGGTQPN